MYLEKRIMNMEYSLQQERDEINLAKKQYSNKIDVKYINEPTFLPTPKDAVFFHSTTTFYCLKNIYTLILCEYIVHCTV